MKSGRGLCKLLAICVHLLPLVLSLSLSLFTHCLSIPPALTQADVSSHLITLSSTLPSHRLSHTHTHTHTHRSTSPEPEWIISESSMTLTLHRSSAESFLHPSLCLSDHIDSWISCNMERKSKNDMTFLSFCYLIAHELHPIRIQRGMYYV